MPNSREEEFRAIQSPTQMSLVDMSISESSQNVDTQTDIPLIGPNDTLQALESDLNDIKNPKVNRENSYIWTFVDDARRVFNTSSHDHGNAQVVDRPSYAFLQSPSARHSTNAVSLPHKGYISHLARIADYHLHTNHYFFDHSAFTDQLSRMSPRKLASCSNVWQVRIFAVIAVGKLFLEKGATDFGPPGIEEFLQCIKSIPPAIDLAQDALSAMEILCLLAFYAHAMGIHTVAYLYLGQASRLARSKGFDRPLSQNPSTGPEQKIWWTISTLDQRLAAMINIAPDWSLEHAGINPLVHVGTPSCGSDFRLRANLAIANTLTDMRKVLSKYQGHDLMSPSFARDMSLPLSALREMGQSIMASEPLCYEQSISTISRSAATLQLLICHCVIMSTTPLLLQLVTSTLRQFQGFAAPLVVSEFPTHMLKTCMNAAVLSLSVMSALRDQSLLEAFVFFDGEITFLSSLSVVLASVLNNNSRDSTLINAACEVLGDMERRGNVLAGVLKDEIRDLRRSANRAILTGRKITPALVETPAALIQNGEALNNAALELIELTPVSASHIDQMSTQVPTSVAEAGEGPQQQAFVVQEPTNHMESGVRVPALSRGGSILAPSAQPCLDYFDSMENLLDFDMADPDWLDFV